MNSSYSWHSVSFLSVRVGYTSRIPPNLRCLDKQSSAQGELYWDDGETIVTDFAQHNYYHFTYKVTVDKTKTSVVITADHVPKTALKLPTLGQIEFLGYGFKPTLTKATLNGQPLTVDGRQSTYSPFKKYLQVITKDLVDLNTGGPTWTVSWPNIPA